MLKKENILNLDLWIYVFINILLADSLVFMFLYGFISLLIEAALGYKDYSQYIIIVGLILWLVKLPVLIWYYRIFYKRTSSSLVKYLIKSIKYNKNQARLKVLLFIYLPYFLLTMVNTIVEARLTEILTNTLICIFISAFFPYLIFYQYLDWENEVSKIDKTETSRFKILFGYLKKKYLKPIAAVIVLLLICMVNYQYDLIPYQGIGIKRYQELCTVCSESHSLENIPRYRKLQDNDYRTYANCDEEFFAEKSRDYEYDILEYLGDKVEKNNTSSYQAGNLYYDYKNELIMIKEQYPKDDIYYNCYYDKNGKIVAKTFYSRDVDYIFNKKNELMYTITSTHFGRIVSDKKENYVR